MQTGISFVYTLFLFKCLNWNIVPLSERSMPFSFVSYVRGTPATSGLAGFSLVSIRK